jgi:MFS family permease
MLQTNGAQLVLYFFLGPETLYISGGDARPQGSALRQKYFHFKRIDPTPLRFWDFVQPFIFAGRPCVMIATAAYAMVWLFAYVMTNIEIPELYSVKFRLNTQQVGLQFLGVIIGSVIGEQIGGFMSDQWMWQRRKKIGRSPEHEYRLWLSYIGIALSICGVVVFLVQIEKANTHWNVTPTIGAAIAAAGYQIVTTVYITYAVDCYRPEAASIGVFITLVRQVWGFIGPFW